MPSRIEPKVHPEVWHRRLRRILEVCRPNALPGQLRKKYFFNREVADYKPQSFSSKGCPRTFWIRLVPYDHNWGQFQNGWLTAPLMKVRMMAQPSQSVTLNHPPNGSRNARILKRLNRNPSNQSKKRNTLFLKKAK